ncbi:MAG: hypothetical protein LKM35_04180 [Lachnospiraceae bacterium]|nr:hypothetical protein [Lachnospiraceae bacterium]
MTKNLVGRSWKDTDSFEYKLTAGTNNNPGMTTPVPTSLTGTATSTSKAVTFGPISYTKAGVYNYTIQEVVPAEKNRGVAYDTAEHAVVVTVTDDGSGKLTAAVTYDDGSATLTSTNTYSASGTASLTVTKNLVGRSWKDTDSFEYKLTAGTNSNPGMTTPVPTSLTGTATSTSKAVTFGPISYTKAGTYNYTIQEVVPAKPIPGVAYDTLEHAVVVTVTDDGSGNLTAAVTYDGARSLTSTNTYSASGTASLTVTKNLVGRSWKDTDSFEYKLTAGTNSNPGMKTPVPTSLTGTATSTSKAVTFGPISYTKAGTYSYTIQEVVPAEKIAGVAYDTLEHAVVVTVTDDGSGNLTAAVTYDGATSLTSTNTYSASGTASLTVTKALAGRAWNNTDSFEYKLTAGTNSNPGMKTPVPTSLTGTATSTNKTVTFGPISYTKAGTYSYTIQEVVPAKPIAGVAYDTAEHAVVVTVTDDGSGKLTAAVTYDGAATLTSTNTYSASGTASLTVTKNLVGRSWKETDSFEYALSAGTNTAGGETPLPDTTTGNATSARQAVTFGPISYTKAGVYNYTIQEVVPAEKIAGVAYDTAEHAVVVTVTDDGSGKLTAVVAYDGATSLTSTNTYSASGTASLTVTKNLVGRSWKDTDSFEYKLTAGTNSNPGMTTPVPTSLTGTATSTSKAVTFGPISYTKAGTYNYTIQEVVPAKPIPGVAYDTLEHAVVVTVTDDGSGNLTAAVTYDGARSLTSTNTYSASGTASLTVTKNLVGRSWKDTDSFEYKLTAGTNSNPGMTTPVPTSLTGTATSTSKAVTFGPISYTKAGTYSYTIQEVVPANPIAGVAYDTAEHAVVVTVTDDGSGKLTAAVTYDDGSATLTSTNTYSASGTASLTVTKNLVGRSWKETDSFEYALSAGTNTAGGETPLPDTTTCNATSASQAVTFGPISYTKAGTYNYTIQEVVPAKPIPGVAYDTLEHAVVVTVTDDGSGNLTAAVTYDGATSLTSTNTYSASGTASLTVTKNLVGRSWKDTDSFEYKLTAGTNSNPGMTTPVPTSLTGTATSTSKAVTFGPISYTKAGTYNYTIQEVVPANPIAGVAYDTAEHAVVVTVTDDGSGNLTAAVTYDGATSLTSTNTYSASGTASLTVTKNLVGRSWKDTDSFEYKLTAGTNSNPGMKTPVPTSLTGTATSTSKAVTFGPISYTKAGTYSYTIQEVVPAEKIAGVAYDTLEHSVVVTVTDDGSGNLTAAVTYDGATSLTSTNTYSASGTASLTVTKALAGRAWNNTDSFEYKLTAGTNSNPGMKTPVPTSLTGTATSTNKTVTFGPISYTKTGTYSYTIQEVVPSNPIAGVAYDTLEHAVMVTVTDDGSGKLTAAVTYDGAATLTSTNTYSASGTASLTVTKNLVGRSWKETDSFEYALSAGTNTAGVETPMPDTTTGSATSASPAVTFGPISYAKAGVYNYTIKEVVPAEKIAGVAYDTLEHAVVVTVTDDGSGNLTAAVTHQAVLS